METTTRKTLFSSSQRQTKLRRPRLISIDHSIVSDKSAGFQFASQLLLAASKAGLRPALATHAQFQPDVKPPVPIASIFNTRDMASWSLRIDGCSKFRRDVSGQSTGGSSLQNTWHRMSESLLPTEQRPANMLWQWSSDLVSLIQTVRLRKGDVFLLNAADDFTILALARAFQQIDFPTPIRVDMIFHLPVQDAKSDPARAQHFALQVNDGVRLLQPHDVCLHATSAELAKQMGSLGLRLKVTSIPLPVQMAAVSPPRQRLPLRILIAGTAKTIGRQQAIADCLRDIEGSFLKPGRCQAIMKQPLPIEDNDFDSLLSQQSRDSFRRAVQGDKAAAMELVADLSNPQYQEWIGSADVAVFLHDPIRYAAKASSVLLEMMIRGVPVIVPDKCWLAEQVRAAGGHRSIGLIYQDRTQVPNLLRQFLRHRQELVQRSAQHAKVIATNHNPQRVLQSMGIADVLRPSRVA